MTLRGTPPFLLSGSEQAVGLEAVVSLPADHDVVVNLDVE
jgi:hypothetical protein